jgi:hypothetical protein
VKVTDVPAHTLLVDALMLTVGVTEGVTLMVNIFETAAEGDAHDSLEVMIQLT